MAVKTGKAKFGGDYVKRKYFKLKDGTSEFRILPPLGFNGAEPDGKWSQFYNVHYGYANSKGEMRVFQSSLVKNRKTKMIEAGDAALDRINAIKAEVEKAKAAGDTAREKKLQELAGGQKSKYNLDNNHYLNAIDDQGNIGILKLRHRAKLALDVEIKRLRDKGVEPLDVDTGRVFVFTRSGMGLDTTFKVDTKKKRFMVDQVGEVEQEVVHVLTDDILNRLEKEAAQLDKLFKRPTSEEVARIVAESDILTGKSRAVDEILDAKQDAATQAEPDVEDEGPDVEDEPAATTGGALQPTSAAVLTSNPPQTPPPASNNAAITTTQAATTTPAATVTTAPITTAPATKPTTGATVTVGSAPKTTAQVVTEQSDAEFLKSLGITFGA